MCSARTSTRNASPITTSSIASSKSSAKRDMCAPFWCGSRSTVQSIRAAISRSCVPWRRRIAFSTPLTPTRESASGTSGAAACRSSSMSRRVPMERCPVTLPGGFVLTEFAGLVSLACHDLRTPLATVRGFAKTLQRAAALDETQARYLELIDAASDELTELVDLLGLVARVEGGRHELTPVDAQTAELARAVADELGAERVRVVGDGVEAQLDAPLVQRTLAGYASCALRHGGLDEVEL